MSNNNTKIYIVQILDKKEIGLHARPASKIVSAINDSKYQDTTVSLLKLDDNVDINKEVKFTGNERKVNAKSILHFLTLEVKHEQKIAFIAEGPHSTEIIETIKKVLKEEELIA